MTKYVPAAGSVLTSKDAKRYGEVISAIAEGNQGNGVTPEELLEEAKKKASPLHGFFEWDDTEAARKYRVHQASYLLRSIHIIVDGNPVRAFFNVKVLVDHSERRAYETTATVFSKEEYRKQILESALKDLESFQRKYSQCKELASLFTVIRKTVKNLVKK